MVYYDIQLYLHTATVFFSVCFSLYCIQVLFRMNIVINFSFCYLFHVLFEGHGVVPLFSAARFVSEEFFIVQKGGERKKPLSLSLSVSLSLSLSYFFFFLFIRWSLQSPQWRWQCIAGPSGFCRACGLWECGLARFLFWVACKPGSSHQDRVTTSRLGWALLRYRTPHSTSPAGLHWQNTIMFRLENFHPCDVDALHFHCAPLAQCIRLWRWFSCPSFPLVDNHRPGLKSILCPGFIIQGFPSLRLEVITRLLIAWWSCHRTSKGFPLGMTVPPVNPPRPGRIIAIWFRTAYSTRQAWLILQLTSISEGLSPLSAPGDLPGRGWSPNYRIGGSLLQVSLIQHALDTQWLTHTHL